TSTPTVIPTQTSSPTVTPTDTANPTITPSATDTLIPPATFTSTASPTASATATNTLRPTVTSTRTPNPTITHTPSPTVSPTPTSTEAIAQPVIPTATWPLPSQTFTPFPSLTPDDIATRQAQTVEARDPTATPGGIYTMTPRPIVTVTPPPAITSANSPVNTPAAGNGTIYDPNAAPATQPALPVGPGGDTGPGSSAPLLPEQSFIVVSFAGQIVPLLDLSGINTGSSAPLAQGEVFGVSATGQVAAVGPDQQLYVNGAPLHTSPASEFGLPPNLTIEDIVWSPDGNRLAFRVDAINPNEQNAINSGVWVYEPGSNRSWQVFRNTHQGQVEQLHEQQQALAIQWSPDGGGLVIAVTTPLGPANVVMSTFRDINQPATNAPIDPLPYAFATWTADSTALIVSGYKWNEMTVIGRVAINESRTYMPYLVQATSGLITQAAVELYDRRIAFLGGPSPGAFALYVMWPGTPHIQVSGTLDGQILSAEWNRERSAVLVTTQTGAGYRLWLVRIDGTTQDITPTVGFPAAVHWR
ncbi:MAG: hypothetical protein JXQ72_17635, partial [Anaerolineae bacterium]|nr:hypothetical protein [Anaerolineae bacterium]